MPMRNRPNGNQKDFISRLYNDFERNTTTVQQCSATFNEKNIAYTWDKSNPSTGDYPPGRLDFVFFTNSVMSVDKSFIISTEHMSQSLLTENNLYWDDTKNASDHFPVVVDFVIETVNQTHIEECKTEKSILCIVDLLGRKVNEKYNQNLLFIYDDGSIEKKYLLK